MAFIERLRWLQGFVCPACAANESPYRASRHRLMCRRCRHQTSVTAGPFLIRTRTPLRVWLAGAWYVTNQKLGVSALGLQGVLGLGSYQTAWTMLHRFRRAMVRPEREKLNGLVEVDETYHATGYIHRGRSQTQTASELVELSGYPLCLYSIARTRLISHSTAARNAALAHSPVFGYAT